MLLDIVTYTYDDGSWGDLLTAYDGNAITYDEVGNPLSDGTWTYTWKHGRELASMIGSSGTWTFTYDANGLRKTRTGSTGTYTYYYEGNRLIHMMLGYIPMSFTYDIEGAPAAVNYNGTVYYYVTNLQGDVIAICKERIGFSWVE